MSYEWSYFNEKRSKRNIVGNAIGITLLVLFCGYFMYTADQEAGEAWRNRNRDPRQGRVWLNQHHSGSKWCDGSTLIYESHGRGADGVSALAHHPACR